MSGGVRGRKFLIQRNSLLLDLINNDYYLTDCKMDVVCDKNNHFTTFPLSGELSTVRMEKEVRLMNRKYGKVILFAIVSIIFFFFAIKKTNSFSEDAIITILFYVVAVLNAIIAIIQYRNELKKNK